MQEEEKSRNAHQHNYTKVESKRKPKMLNIEGHADLPIVEEGDSIFGKKSENSRMEEEEAILMRELLQEEEPCARVEEEELAPENKIFFRYEIDEMNFPKESFVLEEGAGGENHSQIYNSLLGKIQPLLAFYCIAVIPQIKTSFNELSSDVGNRSGKIKSKKEQLKNWLKEVLSYREISASRGSLQTLSKSSLVNSYVDLKTMTGIIPPFIQKESLLKYGLKKIIKKCLLKHKITFCFTYKDMMILNFKNACPLMVRFNPLKKRCVTKILSKCSSDKKVEFKNFGVLLNKNYDKCVRGILMVKEKVVTEAAKGLIFEEEEEGEEVIKTVLRYANCSLGKTYDLIEAKESIDYGKGLRFSQRFFGFQISRHEINVKILEEGTLVDGEDLLLLDIHKYSGKIGGDQEIIDFFCLDAEGSERFLLCLTSNWLMIGDVSDRDMSNMDWISIEKIFTKEKRFDKHIDQVIVERIFGFYSQESGTFETVIQFRVAPEEGEFPEYYILHSEILRTIDPEDIRFELGASKVYKISPEMIRDGQDCTEFKKSNYKIKELKMKWRADSIAVGTVFDHRFVDNKDLSLIKFNIPNFDYLRKKKIQEKYLKKIETEGESVEKELALKGIQVFFCKRTTNFAPIFALNLEDYHLNEEYRGVDSITYLNADFEFYVVRGKDFTSVGGNCESYFQLVPKQGKGLKTVDGWLGEQG